MLCQAGELQAKRFVESEAPKELKIESQNGKLVIACLVCKPKVIPLAGRPSYKLRVREHLKTAKHREARDGAQWKMRQKSILLRVSHRPSQVIIINEKKPTS